VAIERRNTKQLKQLPADKSCEYTNSVVAPHRNLWTSLRSTIFASRTLQLSASMTGAITIDARRLCSRRALNVWRWGMRIGNAEMLAPLEAGSFRLRVLT